VSSVAAKSPAETKTRLPFVVVLLAVGTPTISVATMLLPKRLTLVLSLDLFAVGHIVAALSPAFEIVLVARGITALAVSAFNVSIAAATWLAGVALDSSLGATGPSAVGAAMAILGLIPLIILALMRATRATTHTPASEAAHQTTNVTTLERDLLV
jgi:predicted MFS family arabinose efflux permease